MLFRKKRPTNKVLTAHKQALKDAVKSSSAQTAILKGMVGEDGFTVIVAAAMGAKQQRRLR